MEITFLKTDSKQIYIVIGSNGLIGSSLVNSFKKRFSFLLKFWLYNNKDDNEIRKPFISGMINLLFFSSKFKREFGKDYLKRLSLHIDNC